MLQYDDIKNENHINNNYYYNRLPDLIYFHFQKESIPLERQNKFYKIPHQSSNLMKTQIKHETY